MQGAGARTHRTARPLRQSEDPTRLTGNGARGFAPITFQGKWGKSPGTQVQHALAIRTRGTEFRHFLSSNCGTIWACVESARGFAPITTRPAKPLVNTRRSRKRKTCHLLSAKLFGS